MTTSCLICHGKVTASEARVTCTNSHQVHLQCLRTWVRAAKLLSTGDLYCPICHSSYPVDVVNEIFGLKQEFRKAGKPISFELHVVDEEDRDEEESTPTWKRYARKINLAQEAIDKFDHEIAILHLFDILQENPEDVDATFLFGVVNFQRNNYLLAQHFFYKTIQLDPAHYLANLFLAEIMLKDERMRESLVLFKKVRALIELRSGVEVAMKNKDWELVMARIAYISGLLRGGDSMT
ncbi:MAG: hypothetical protein ACTSU9_14520 [Promethearchaeota archaeon]